MPFTALQQGPQSVHNVSWFTAATVIEGLAPQVVPGSGFLETSIEILI